MPDLARGSHHAGNISSPRAISLERSTHRTVRRPPPKHTLSILIQPADSLCIPRLPLNRQKLGEKTVPIRTQARGATILPSFVGLKFQIHNGKVYHDLMVTEDMVGHKLGEFSP